MSALAQKVKSDELLNDPLGCIAAGMIFCVSQA